MAPIAPAQDAAIKPDVAAADPKLHVAAPAEPAAPAAPAETPKA
jgi:hypothetical protein